MNRRLILLGTLLLGLAALVVLNLPDADVSPSDDRSNVVSEDEREREMLEGTAPDEPVEVDEEGAARLTGRGAPAGSGPVTVHVENDRGVPIPRVLVSVIGWTNDSLLPNTDDDGIARLSDDLPWDGTLKVVVHVDPPQRSTIDGPTIRIVRPTLVPFTLRTVDAETGEPVRVDDMKVHCERRPGEERVSEGVVTYMARAGRETLFGAYLTFREVSGWVAWDATGWSVHRSAYAERLEVVAPLRREVPVSVMVLNHDGDPCAEAHIASFTVAGKTKHAPTTEQDAYGNRHVSGVPYYRGERLTVSAAIAETTAVAQASMILGPHPDLAVELQIRLPKPEPTADNSTIGIGGGSSYSSRSRGRRRKPHPMGTVIARVFRHNGSPAVNARVSGARCSARTDKTGRAVLKECLPGRYKIIARQAGLLTASTEIEIIEDGTVEIELRESKGLRRDIEVVDENGDPLPFARFESRRGNGRGEWIDEVEGVQRLDLFTDHEGRRTLLRVGPHITHFAVSWGSRKATIDLGDGETGTLRVVLARP